ncbi:family 20 glycosylhydrolase [Saccharicrinis sp. GN24d3]|uniref:family 20 glycosylhydrolase n=1 Tax=Saccharicrinis sp. GN24d3 TaxID=3458416 RepID=UPI004035172D
MTDDEGWRIESKKFPRLNQVASYVNKVGSFVDGKAQEFNGYYTVEDIHEILAYAKARNIEVIPEFDVPGHNWALLTAYPEFRCPNQPAANALCGSNEGAMLMVKSLFDEIIDIFNPKYIHIGGDERKKELWNNCPLCKAKMERLELKDEHFLQNHYLNEVTKHIHTKGITTIAWAEHLDGGIPEGQITQAWRLRNEAISAIKKGNQVVVSDNGECYLDYPANVEAKKTKPDWMPVLSSKKVYNFDFTPPQIPQGKEHLVLGGECPLWTEEIKEADIYPQIEERIEAHAERSWTAKELKDFNRFHKCYEVLYDYFNHFFPNQNRGN